MPQRRAVATRQNILDAAVALFIEKGYAETGLTDVTKKANITTGAFYYHFDSKEALGKAIIAAGWPKAVEVINGCLESPAPGLERVIMMTFALSDLMKRDRSVWLANHLNQAFGELSQEGRAGFRQRASTFVEKTAAALQPSDIRDDITPTEVGSLVWITVHGCHLLSDAMHDNVFHRLALSWRVLLGSIAPEGSRDYFELFVKRAAAQYDDR